MVGLKPPDHVEPEAGWDGQLVLMARRAGLSDLGRRFDITWFMGAIHKYRRLLGEVLVASFFLQLFALVSPLFFQVIIDKVLVHRTLSTLDVLVIGLVSISFFLQLFALVSPLFSQDLVDDDLEKQRRDQGEELQKKRGDQHLAQQAPVFV